MRVLVLGGSRFVGPILVKLLLDRSHEVTLFNRGHLYGDVPAWQGSVERLIGDRTTADFERLLTGRRFDAAVDFAAYEGRDIDGVLETLRVAHYVFISSGQVYLVRKGIAQSTLGAREVDYAGPLLDTVDPGELSEWEYGIRKRNCEDRLIAASRQFPSTRLRIPMVQGEGDYSRRVDEYVFRLRDGLQLLLPVGGNARMRQVYAPDVARAIATILGDARTIGEAYNLAQDETPTLREFVQLCAAAMSTDAQLVDVPRETIEKAGLNPAAISPFSTRWMSFIDPSRAKSEWGFQHTPLHTYVDRIVENLLAHPPDPPSGYALRARELALV
ncbi:MAG: SDR family oxidoreductase [Polyangiales bacterium]